MIMWFLLMATLLAAADLTLDHVTVAGTDLKEMQARRTEGDKGAASFAALFHQCSALMQQIVALPKPVIARPPRTSSRSFTTSCGAWRRAKWLRNLRA